MMMALIAPEMVIIWALRQWLAARKLANSKKYKKYGWTPTHGFFAVMGGFKFYDNNGSVLTLQPQELESLARDGEIDFPRITKREIQDRSKGDALSKGLVVIQTSWFILQCIARRIEHLPITELELMALAFAALNFVTYALWWNKPLDVQCPVRVLYKRRQGESEESKGVAESRSQSPDDEESGEDSGGWGTDTMAVLGTLLAAIGSAMWAVVRKTPEAVGEAIFHTVRDAIVCSVKYIGQYGWWGTFSNGVNGVVGVIVYPITRIAAMGWGDKEPGSMFYGGDNGGVSRLSIGVAGAVIATIFGAIHCVAWSFQFPSHAEQLLWRMASLAITCAPMVILFPVLGFEWLKWLVGPDPISHVMPRRVIEPVVLIGSVVFVALPLFLYTLSRVVLLVIVFMSLRSLPPGAYETVHWITFIPHL